MTAELILVNGRFSTLDRSNLSSEAVAVAGGRFLAVGTRAEIQALAGSQTKLLASAGSAPFPA